MEALSIVPGFYTFKNRNSRLLLILHKKAGIPKKNTA